MTKPAVRLYKLGAAIVFLLLVSSSADAQYRPRPVSSSALGDNYHVEISAGLWRPAADMSLSIALGQRY